MKAWLQLFRIHHWVKNVLVFAGLIFSRSFYNPMLAREALLTFLAFCFASSFVYVLNDWRDMEKDKMHPQKCHRPLAAGILNINSALPAAIIVGLAGLGVAYYVSIGVFAIVSGYILLNIAYSLWLKNLMLLDVFTISAGFMLRLLAGTAGLGIKPSAWLILCGMMLTLFLGFAKRYVEWKREEEDNSPRSRRVLDNYTLPLLDKYLSMTGIASIICYSLYTVDSATVMQLGSNVMVWSVPPVVFCIFQFLYLVQKKQAGENLSKEIWQNPGLIISSGIWAFIVGIILVLSRA
ncbi:MAG: decaprenyl-phosphate phosphoribosyltransferase [Victivallaceae bacterium]